MRAGVWVALLCLYPALNHFAVTRQEYGLALGVLVMLLACTAVLLLGKGVGAVFAFLPLLALVFVGPKTLLYFPPVLINLFGFGFFARSLRVGRQPVISRIATLERGKLTPELAAYTRRLTWIWTIFFALMASISAFLAVFAPMNWWSLFTNCINYLLVGLLYFGEFAYRRRRYRQYHHASPFQIIRSIRNKSVAQHRSQQVSQ